MPEGRLRGGGAAHRAAGGHEAANELSALPGEHGGAAADEVEAGHSDARQDGPPVQLRCSARVSLLMGAPSSTGSSTLSCRGQ